MSCYLKPFIRIAQIAYRGNPAVKHFAYKSAVNLENLYPGKSPEVFTPDKVSWTADGGFSGFIPIDKLQITYSRSSGAGGQNVNILNTKVEVRFHVESADWLDAEVKSKLLEMNKTKVNKEGYLIMKSEKTRSQQLNVADVMMKLRSIIRMASESPKQPSEESLEKARKRRMRAAQLRLQEKHHRSMTKAQRCAPVVDY